MTQTTLVSDEQRRTLRASAALVIDTTRRAWLTTPETRSIDMAAAPHTRQAGFPRRPMQAGMLIAMNFWSHETL